MDKMRIVAYRDETFDSRISNGVYAVMLNPEKVQRGRQVQYNDESAVASSAPASKYNRTLSEKLSFELVIDCTGVVDSKRVNLPDEIAKLSKVVYEYNGEIHRPNYVIVNWGEGLSFRCVLTVFNTTYTLFRPDGTPLRARVALEFASYIDMKTLAQQESRESPDMSHLVPVVDGMTLPQLSNVQYGSPACYIQLARFNRLDKFRQLEAGSTLAVPPLKAKGMVHA